MTLGHCECSKCLSELKAFPSRERVMDKIFWRNLGRNPAKEQFAIPSASQIAQVQNMQRSRVFSELHKLGGWEIELFFWDLKVPIYFFARLRFVFNLAIPDCPLNTFLSYKARCGGRYGCGADNEPKYLCLEELPPAILKLRWEKKKRQQFCSSRDATSISS